MEEKIICLTTNANRKVRNDSKNIFSKLYWRWLRSPLCLALSMRMTRLMYRVSQKYLTHFLSHKNIWQFSKHPMFSEIIPGHSKFFSLVYNWESLSQTRTTKVLKTRGILQFCVHQKVNYVTWNNGADSIMQTHDTHHQTHQEKPRPHNSISQCVQNFHEHGSMKFQSNLGELLWNLRTSGGYPIMLLGSEEHLHEHQKMVSIFSEVLSYDFFERDFTSFRTDF